MANTETTTRRLRLPRRLVLKRGVEAPNVPPMTVAERHVPRDWLLRRLLALGDLAGITIALVVQALVSKRFTVTHLEWGLLTLPVWVLIFNAYGLYNRDIQRVSHTAADDLPGILHGLLVGSLGLWLYFMVTPPAKILFAEVLIFGVLATASITAFRGLARRAARAVHGAERVLFVGEGDATTLLVRKMRAHPEYDLEPAGQIGGDTGGPLGTALPVLGELDSFDLVGVSRTHRIDRVVVARSDLDESAVLEILRQCKQLSLKVSLLPQLFDAMGPAVVVDDVEGITLLGINPPVLPRSSRIMKRGLDVVYALLGLLLALPAIAVIALAVKLDSPGPVFFRQQRIGRKGKRFGLVKFRSMQMDAERRRQALLAHSTDPGWLKLDHDPRITRVGRFLRLTSLDELPQLWNVLKGEMSLVGPRPLIAAEDGQLDGWARSRLDLTPGITGLWQVLGRTNIPFEEMLKLDYLYVTNWSLWTDFKLILRTLPAVVARRGAN